jgi:ribosomal 50S subunit-recycling heat shock protein
MLTMAQLHAMDESTLRDLNRNVVEAIRTKVNGRVREAANDFRRGDKATFWHKGRQWTIEIDRFNTKTITGTVLDAEGRRTLQTYRVPPTMLTKVKAPEVKKPETVATGHPMGDAPVTRKPGQSPW